jgi:hypothetical protein
MTTKVSRSFMRDFAYCANFYEWDAATVEDVKEQTRGNPELMRYWQELATAHRAGYRQDATNNWQRLGHWQQTANERRREARNEDF